MKKLFILKNYFLLLIILITACSVLENELFKETDNFVNALATTQESYGLLGGTKYAVTTSDNQYSITPVGRLINVKILKVATNSEYEDLRIEIENHYKDDKRVNKVYICGAGTIMIDCRN